MVFSSLFFVGVFLPAFLLIYYRVNGVSAKDRVMLIFSLIFYGFGGVKYLLLLVLMSLIAWFFTKKIYNTRDYTIKRRYLVLCICLYLLNLIIFKYTGFFWDTYAYFSGAKSGLLSIALPVGISFYTFKLISYTADVYWGNITAFHKFSSMLFYTSLFHHSIQGPIVRVSDMKEDMYFRRIDKYCLSEGAFRFIVGLGKKLILADPMGEVANTLVPLSGGDVTVLGTWIGMLAFSLQLYLDFSGYSDMALGLGRMCGFTYPENFNYPYIASSVQDFWRRWHISLGSFFRDYVYIPMGGSRCGALRLTLNLFVVWALTGFWHGAGWNFIFWGLYYFVLLGIERLIKPTTRKGLRYVWYPLTFILVVFGWLLFRFTNADTLITMIKSFFGLAGNAFYERNVGIVLKNNIMLFVASMVASTPLAVYLLDKLPDNEKLIETLKIVFMVVVFVVCTLSMAGDSYTPFLYEKF